MSTSEHTSELPTQVVIMRNLSERWQRKSIAIEDCNEEEIPNLKALLLQSLRYWTSLLTAVHRLQDWNSMVFYPGHIRKKFKLLTCSIQSEGIVKPTHWQICKPDALKGVEFYPLMKSIPVQLEAMLCTLNGSRTCSTTLYGLTMILDIKRYCII